MIAREEIVGFYSSGPKIKENDIKIVSLFRQYCADPIFVIIDVRQGVEGLPTTAYESVEEVEEQGKEIQRTFKHIPCSIVAEEAEEVMCMEHRYALNKYSGRSESSTFFAISTIPPPACLLFKSSRKSLVFQDW